MTYNSEQVWHYQVRISVNVFLYSSSKENGGESCYDIPHLIHSWGKEIYGRKKDNRVEITNSVGIGLVFNEKQ
jgi:hypothetical protein